MENVIKVNIQITIHYNAKDFSKCYKMNMILLSMILKQHYLKVINIFRNIKLNLNQIMNTKYNLMYNQMINFIFLLYGHHKEFIKVGID